GAWCRRSSSGSSHGPGVLLVAGLFVLGRREADMPLRLLPGRGLHLGEPARAAHVGVHAGEVVAEPARDELGLLDPGLGVRARFRVPDREEPVALGELTITGFGRPAERNDIVEGGGELDPGSVGPIPVVLLPGPEIQTRLSVARRRLRIRGDEPLEGFTDLRVYL